MTKQEMLDRLSEITSEMDEAVLAEVITFADYIAWRGAGFPDEETQIREVEEDYEKGEVVTLEEA
jgi:hypothetical protein